MCAGPTWKKFYTEYLQLYKEKDNWDVEKHKITWINNLITGSGKNLASPGHKNNKMPYVQEYLKTYGEKG